MNKSILTKREKEVFYLLIKNKVHYQRDRQHIHNRRQLFVFAGRQFDENVCQDTCRDTGSDTAREDHEHDHDKGAEGIGKIAEVDILDTGYHQESYEDQSRACSSVRDHQYQR